jgi:hypothetical protein
VAVTFRLKGERDRPGRSVRRLAGHFPLSAVW